MYDACALPGQGFDLSGLKLDIAGKTLIDIQRLSLTNPGVTVVMGPNGAGKSLLLRLLHGLIAPTSGDIRCYGSPTSKVVYRSHSLVLQSPVLLRRTAEANVRFVLKMRRLPLERAVGLLKRVKLERDAKTPARRLSGGEKQRLAIAQALATDPTMLMLDEPTSSLDPASTMMIEDILRTTVKKGTRVLLVTHDAAQARRLADDVVFLAGGRVVEHAPAGTFFDTPQTEEARAYLAGRLTR